VIAFAYTRDQELWLNDLETTTENQVVQKLHEIDEEQQAGFCCMGRACAVLDIDNCFLSYRDDDDTGRYEYGKPSDESDEILPNFVFQRLNLRSRGGEFNVTSDMRKSHTEMGGREKAYLWILNDELNWTFKEIAAFIRMYPTAFFTN
jgi:hypothetical protein